MFFAYLMLTEGTQARHPNTHSKLWSRTWESKMDTCQPDNGVSFNKNRFKCGNQIWNSRSQHCLHSWSGTKLGERKELRHWPRHAPAVCYYLFPPPLNATIQLAFISLLDVIFATWENNRKGGEVLKMLFGLFLRTQQFLLFFIREKIETLKSA